MREWIFLRSSPAWPKRPILHRIRVIGPEFVAAGFRGSHGIWPKSGRARLPAIRGTIPTDYVLCGTFSLRYPAHTTICSNGKTLSPNSETGSIFSCVSEEDGQLDT